MLEGKAFEALQDEKVLEKVEIFHGIMTWMDKKIDIAPETVYELSFAYTPVEAVAR